ncbi:IMP cyclohydrolase /phosphoribosylaminoimidazolecarboxamide formyltransferase [Nitrosomonas cryotolerans]|uniref:Bifunctional purine biosynthesis protein PurH n=1 Tax=Nitrosomonas cryotolerans ATCC 49181 TaxID=1131553 RepID=A0A1N6IKP7_9PROT|nr:bifunctional phosphoribosylaminoimidazolecarboxamide formyltransferase/IMP cyclohydrolase [Nitrosomonas cryotolerans]SFP37602.1 IMP cyclohydrolase /phosphoribosylaminoimidazolecarboxamide formyltransferase [Nitrosomonas cryotolerans]SIO32592.1 IMP cyclohydrolase /phosphoribosylaminoimidazolecarboxamide formyltransferase [Nitrosomonas cryotolerans ATCC 49181]
MTIKQALISVSDKTGIVDLAQKLSQLGIIILSTGGTAKLLQDAGIAVIEVSDYTGFPEMLDGRVKTLHPIIHAGILARPDLPEHKQALEKAAISGIELVIVNLYPFSQTIAKPNCSLEEAIENIDIGGPTLIRAAAKNYQHVTVLTDPEDYASLLTEIESNNGMVSSAYRFQLAQKAFSHTAAYDSIISNYLTAIDVHKQANVFPEYLNLNFHMAQHLRYGENPHQEAAFYRDQTPVPGGLADYTQIQGKALSYNNIADTDAAWECVKTFNEPACVIVKHANPCGVAIADTLLTAYQHAFATDQTSAFGGIIAFNRTLDKVTAEAIIKQFVEVIIAPEITNEAIQVLAQKPNIRILSLPVQSGQNQFDLKRVGGGLLVQTPDNHNITLNELKVVTKKQPTSQQLEDLLFAWRVAKFIKSNAIVFSANGQTLGIGAGQMSRVDSARIASIKAQQAGFTLTNSVVASDAFFPFRDGLDVVVQAGAKAVIQPGGSVRDAEVIAAADEQNVTMVFSGIRHFRH